MCCCSSYSKAHEYNSGGGLNVKNDSYYTVSSPRSLDVFFRYWWVSQASRLTLIFYGVFMFSVCFSLFSIYFGFLFHKRTLFQSTHTTLTDTPIFLYSIYIYIYFSFAKMLNWIYASKSMTHTHLANTQTESFFYKIKSS